MILIAFLVVLVALFITAALTGVLTKFLERPAFVAVTASPVETGPGTSVIRLYHSQGDPVNLNGTTQSQGSVSIGFILTDPSGTSVFLPFTGTLHTTAWRSGDSLYIYPGGTGGYWYADAAPSSGGLPPGVYTVRIIDTKANLLLHNLTVTIP